MYPELCSHSATGLRTSPRNPAGALQAQHLVTVLDLKVILSNTPTKVCVRPPHHFCPQQKEGTKRPDRSSGLGERAACGTRKLASCARCHREHSWRASVPQLVRRSSEGPQQARLMPVTSPRGFWVGKPWPLPSLALALTPSKVYPEAKVLQKKQGTGQPPAPWSQ